MIYIMKKVYVDLDGVLFDFETKFKEDYGVPIEQLTQKGVDAIKERLAGDMFFANLKPFDGAKAFIEHLVVDGYDVEFLTSIGKFNSDLVLEQKLFAIDLHISKDIKLNYTYSSEDKAKFLKNNNCAILIDDREKSLIPWEIAGGIGIQHISFVDTIVKLYAFQINI